MSFAIAFINEPVPQRWLMPGEKALLVWVTIGNFGESDAIPVGYWSKQDYCRQWQEGASRIVNGDDDTRSALVMAMHDPLNPERGYVLHWWTLYRKGKTVYIRNSGLPYKPSAPTVRLEHLYEYVPERDAQNNDDVSEWTVSVQDMQDFSDSLQSVAMHN